MAYFNHAPEQDYDQEPRAWDEDIEEDGDWSEDEDWDDEMWEDEEMTEEEKRESRRGRMRVAAGVGDFFGVIVGAVCILVLIALLVSLLNWLQADIGQTFTLWQSKL